MPRDAPVIRRAFGDMANSCEVGHLNYPVSAVFFPEWVKNFPFCLQTRTISLSPACASASELSLFNGLRQNLGRKSSLNSLLTAHARKSARGGDCVATLTWLSIFRKI